MTDIGIVTFNVRGLRKNVKRRTVFRFLHQQYPNHLVVLQETHSAPHDSPYWQAEWGSTIYFGHGPNTSECGVAVLIPRSLSGVCNGKVLHDVGNGRLVVLALEYGQLRITLFAVYAPTQGHGQEQVSYFEMLKDKLSNLTPDDSCNIILAGDFNLHLSKLDVYKSRFRSTEAARILIDMLNDMDLIDVWRDRNRTSRRYTWRRLNPLQQSRIDYIFASANLINNYILKRIEIQLSVLSDHSILNLEISVHTSDKGPGLWRFNNSLLEDEMFVRGARLEIEKAKHNQDVYADAKDLGLKIEMLTSNIRVQGIRITKRRAREKRARLKGLTDMLDICEQEICQNPSDEIIHRYRELQTRIDLEEEEKGRVAMLFSGARWIEEGEKPTKYFLKLNKIRSSKKCISALQKPCGQFITGREEVMQYCSDHFRNIYASKATHSPRRNLVKDFLRPSVCPRLDDIGKTACDGPITNRECELALKGMLNNKAASVSGYSKEFFLFFWVEMGEMVVEYINQAREVGHFFITQRRGVITLIPKKGDQKIITNKRAICLLDIIYKIVAKVISNRIMVVMNSIVAPDQTGSIKDRYIGTNIRTIADVIHYCEVDKLDGILMALDFKNAFNTVELDFVYDVLREFNFGSSFISWVQLLHNKTELAIINNGHTSQWFNPSRGLQQGCPASALLFALVVEILAIKVRETNTVKGIEVSHNIFKISQYCDDTTLFVNNISSADNVICIVNEFGTASGLELNMDKCDFMWLGRRRNCQNRVCGKDPVKSIKILGVTFSATVDCNLVNLESVEMKMKRTMDQWLQRQLTIKGRITVVKSLIVSQMMYIMAAMIIDKKHLTRIQGNIMKFIWRGRPPKVAKNTLSMEVEKGGLKVPDLISINASSRVAWIGRIARQQEATFVKTLQNRLQATICDILHINIDMTWIKSRLIPGFYEEMVTCFKALQLTRQPACGKEVRRQLMWHNLAVQVDRKTLTSGTLYREGIKLIDDFVDEQGNLLSHASFLSQYPFLHINPLVYMGWQRAIPAHWRRMLMNSEPLTIAERAKELEVSIKNKKVPISFIKSNVFTSYFLPDVVPTAQKRWEAEGVNFGDNWRKYYLIPFQATKSTKLQSLQFRIVHRYFPTRRFLCVRNVVDDPFCDNCGEVETLEHYFFECITVKTFWDELMTILNAKLPPRKGIVLSCYNVIFGGLGYSQVVNLIILVAKQFITRERAREGIINISLFRPCILSAFNMDKTAAFQNQNMARFKERWAAFITEAGSLDL